MSASTVSSATAARAAAPANSGMRSATTGPSGRAEAGDGVPPTLARLAHAGGRSRDALLRLWPLAALVIFATLLRLPTLGLQSFWFDEAFTPVHVLHPSIVATLKTMAHTENTPPLWYVTIWAWTRLFGAGVVAMRLISALAGIALVAVVWAIACELAGRRAAIAAAALTAANPLFVWYSQEARAYELYTLMAALAILCFLRAERRPTAGRMAAFALTGSLALLCHYFAVFLLVPMALWLLRRRERWRVALPAVGAIAIVGLALIPLVLSQGGKGTQWIGEWALSSRVQAIPQYYLTGYSGAPLGHGVELLVALPLIGGLAFGLLRGLARRERQTAVAMLALAACGVLIPIVLALGGADYLAPRNLIGAMVPVTILIAVVIAAASAERLGMAIALLAAFALLAMCVDVSLSPRLQRGDWKAVALAVARAERAGWIQFPPLTNESPGSVARRRVSVRPIAVVTAHLGSAPLEYYLSWLQPAKGASRKVAEIEKVGYKPLLAGAATPPASGFRLVAVQDFHGELLYRFVSAKPRSISLSRLRASGITAGETNVLTSFARVKVTTVNGA